MFPEGGTVAAEASKSVNVERPAGQQSEARDSILADLTSPVKVSSEAMQVSAAVDQTEP